MATIWVISSFHDVSTGHHYVADTYDEVSDPDRLARWQADGLIRDLTAPGCPAQHWPWELHPGVDLSVLGHSPGAWRRVVAVLNVWQDLKALQASLPSWYPFVDHVIAVDGAYVGIPAAKPYSTDGTLEYLRSLDKVELISAPDFWPDQCIKRSQYLHRGQTGDLFFRVDADEQVVGGPVLRDVPDVDVAWTRVQYPQIYSRPYGQPRLFRWIPGLQYIGRHHWIWQTTGCRGGLPLDPLITDQGTARGLETTAVPLLVINRPNDQRPQSRQDARLIHRSTQARVEAKVAGDAPVGRESLRIVQLARIEYGLVVHRLHSAINTTSTHRSIMVRSQDEDPFAAPRQYGLTKDRDFARKAALTSDIVHCHAYYQDLLQLGVPKRAKLVIHHHGTMYRTEAVHCNQMDAQMDARVRLVSNFELLKYGEEGPGSARSHVPLDWLPNPVPVEQYRKLYGYGVWDPQEFVVAHSPSNRANKGTQVLLDVVEELRSKGVKIRVDLIEGRSHAESLRRKSQAHACFDSFWLGLQCSGLEAAAMGKPVIAGDDDCAQGYISTFGAIPYTWVPKGPSGLMDVLERLARSEEFYYAEAIRVYDYVATVHDYSAVVTRYLNILDRRTNWKYEMSLGVFKP